MSLIGSKLTNTSRHHTHLIALGNKGYNHANINARMNKELKLLQSVDYYYVNQCQATLPIVVHPLVAWLVVLNIVHSTVLLVLLEILLVVGCIHHYYRLRN